MPNSAESTVADERDDQAVDQPVEAAIGEQRRLVVDQRRLGGKPDRRHGEIVVARLDRRVEHPVERHTARRPGRSRAAGCGRPERERRLPAAGGADGGHQTGSAFKQPPHQQRHHERGEDQEQPASGRRLRQMELGEADRVEIVGRRVGLRARSAAGHDEDRVEHADRVEQAEGERQQHHRRRDAAAVIAQKACQALTPSSSAAS